MFSGEIRIKQWLSYILFCPLRILYNDKFILKATSLGTNAIVVTRVHCMTFVLSFLVPHLSFLWCLGKTVFRDPGIFRVSSLIQENLNNSNSDDSFPVANSNSFSSPQEILPTAQENEYIGIF